MKMTTLSAIHTRAAQNKNKTKISHYFQNLPMVHIPTIRTVEYVWLDAYGNFRSKSKTLSHPSEESIILSEWNFDGSSTGQAPGKDSEIIIRPLREIDDPFRSGGQSLITLCECVLPNGQPAKGNHYAFADPIFRHKRASQAKPWFGFEQEYVLYQADGITPLGWPKNGKPHKQGPYYCSVGADRAFGRDIVESHYRACLYAGLNISGVNAEVMPGQWEYQIGPVEGIDAAHQLLLSRYLLLRIAEMYGVIVSFHPKPKKGDWNGSGLHTNFSTKGMREEGGYNNILRAMTPLSNNHKRHLAIYGKNNHERLLGSHETSSMDKFSFGVANRGCSVRIPRQVFKDKKGYFEDRRPASNADPYLVSAALTATLMNIKWKIPEEKKKEEEEKKTNS